MPIHKRKTWVYKQSCKEELVDNICKVSVCSVINFDESDALSIFHLAEKYWQYVVTMISAVGGENFTERSIRSAGPAVNLG